MGRPGCPEFAFSTASMAKNRIVLTDFSIKELSVVLSRVSTAAARTAVPTPDPTRGGKVATPRVGLNEEEREEEYLRPEKAGKATRSDDRLLEEWREVDRAKRACERVREEEEAMGSAER